MSNIVSDNLCRIRWERSKTISEFFKKMMQLEEQEQAILNPPKPERLAPVVRLENKWRER
jgi:hypothetical protein